jgi:hypothetical protein
MESTASRRVRRLPVPLTERDEADLRLIRNSPEALGQIGVRADDSDATIVHALMTLGARQAREAAEDAGYAALAADLEERAIELAIRRHGRRRRTATTHE